MYVDQAPQAGQIGGVGVSGAPSVIPPKHALAKAGSGNPDSIIRTGELKRNMFPRQSKLERQPPYTPFAASSNDTSFFKVHRVIFKKFIENGLFHVAVRRRMRGCRDPSIALAQTPNPAHHSKVHRGFSRPFACPTEGTRDTAKTTWKADTTGSCQ